MKQSLGPILGGLLGAALWPGVALLVTWHDELPDSVASQIDIPVMLLFWLVGLPGYLVPQLLFGYAQIGFWGGPRRSDRLESQSTPRPSYAA